MFDIFRKREVDPRIDDMHRAVQESFARVREDTQRAHQWIKYLHYHNQHAHAKLGLQARRIAELEAVLKAMPKSAGELKELIDSHYGWNRLHERIRQLESRLAAVEDLRHSVSAVEDVKHRVAQIEQQHAPVHERLGRLHERVSQLENKEQITPPVSTVAPRNAFKEKILRQLTRNSKNRIKQVILSTVTKYGQVSGLQLREIIVEEQGLCSKSSFYRLLEELEKEQAFTTVAKGKEKQYVAAPHAEIDRS